MDRQEADDLLFGVIDKLQTGVYQAAYKTLSIDWSDPVSIQNAGKQLVTITKGGSKIGNIYTEGKCCE